MRQSVYCWPALLFAPNEVFCSFLFDSADSVLPQFILSDGIEFDRRAPNTSNTTFSILVVVVEIHHPPPVHGTH